MGYRSRREFLGLLGGVSVIGTAGCLLEDDHVSVLSAGSLARTFEEHVGPAFEEATGTAVRGEYFGANAVMRMVEDRTKLPDVIVSADATLLRERLYDEFTDWDIEFASNSVGIGYTERTEFGTRLANGEHWYELARVAESGDIAIGDPDLDPLGYRAVQAFELAGRRYGLAGFRQELLETVYKEPEEPQLLSGVETGSRAGAIVYRNMAVDHGLPFFEFSDQYNFANPDYAEHYASAEFTTDRGYTVEGRPIRYNATVHRDADNPGAGRELVSFLADNPVLLVEAGLTVPESFPVVTGQPPAEVDV